MSKSLGNSITKRLGSLAILFLAAPGCDSGPQTYKVSGTASYNGLPIAVGEINFAPAKISVEGRSYSARIVNGKYELEVTEGNKAVSISGVSNDPAIVGPPPPDMPKGGVNPPRDFVPAKYNVETTLTVDVKPENGQTFPFELLK